MMNLRKLLKALREEPHHEIVSNIETFISGESGDRLDYAYASALSSFIFKARQLTDRKRMVIFVSHETTRTGAPLIVRKLALEFQDRFNGLPLFVNCKGGDLFEVFKDDFLCYFVKNQRPTSTQAQELSTLFSEIVRELGIRDIIINSVESRHILPHVEAAGFDNITFLVHEMGNLYDQGSWYSIDQIADHVIFPAHFIAERAQQNTPFTQPSTYVAGQGLLKPELLDDNLEIDPLRFRRRHGLPNDSIIVLSCGSTIARKGIDVFAFTAISTLNSYKGKRPLFFIWLGSAPPNYFQKWVNHDIEQAGFEDRIIFVGEHEDTIPFFKSCDIFFMTSRGDPYPCVVQEAMAVGMPVVGFKNAGGYPEMLYGPNAYLCNYGDIAGASKAIMDLANDENLRIGRRIDTIEFAKGKFNFSNYADQVFKIATLDRRPTEVEHPAKVV